MEFTKTMQRIQIITSALNEESNIFEFYNRIAKVMQRETEYYWELIIFDNGSTDNTWNRILEISENNPNIKAFRMSRTFTLDAALSAGIDNASADIVITMASDLQDPPELIPDFLRAYEKGNKLVAAQIIERTSLGLKMKVLTKIYYWIADWATEGLLLKNVSDFRLMAKPVYESVRQLQEQHRYLRGITSWVGYKPYLLQIERPPRTSGKSNNKFKPVFELALRGILAHSDKALNSIFWVGLIFSSISFTSIFVLLGIWIIGGVPFAGFGTLISLLLFMFSILLLFLGFIAQYIGLIYLEVKKRPHYVIMDSKNNETNAQ